MLDKEFYHYDASEYLIVSVDLPVIAQITEASKDQPYFVIKIDIDLQQLSELLVHTGLPPRRNSANKRGLFVGKLDDSISECILRLAKLLDKPQDIPILATQTMRELYYRLLTSDDGDTVAQIALEGSHMQRIASALQKIKNEFQQKINIEELAELVGMSLSSFHAHFKSVTAMSPLQYQKSLRLMEARNLMIVNAMDAASSAYQVGYESSSQFNREYARMFGNPPGRDIRLLKGENL